MAYEKELSISYEEGLIRAKEADREEEFLNYCEQGVFSTNEIMSIMHLMKVTDWEWFESDYGDDDS